MDLVLFRSSLASDSSYELWYEGMNGSRCYLSFVYFHVLHALQ